MTLSLIILSSLLAVFVLFLLFRLDEKNIKIIRLEAMVDEMKKIWNKSRTGSSESIKEPDSGHITDKRFSNFIFSDEGKVNIYIHYTLERSIAEKILAEGFFYETVLYKTTEKISNDTIDLAYKHHIRKQYGENVVVIGVSKEVYNKTREHIRKGSRREKLFPEHLLSEPVRLTEDDIHGYRLFPFYIKGFLNYNTGEIVLNKKYNPFFDPTKK